MRTKVFVFGVLFALLVILLVGCGHHKRHKSLHHIINCVTPCDRGNGDGQGHDDHDCHEGHDENNECRD